MSIYKGNQLLSGVATNTISNAHSLFDFIWSDHIKNEMSWLRADTFSWQSGAVYIAAYNHLVADLGEQEAITYCFWKLGMGGYWTISETPSVGDIVYTTAGYDLIPTIHTVEEVVNATQIKIEGDTYTRDSVGDRTVTDYANKTTEHIGSYYISYYLSEDGHKICTPDQATIVNNIYNESGVAWYYILDTTNQRFKLPRTKYGFTGLRDTVGKYVPESLPNIKGTVEGDGTNGQSYANELKGSGAFENTKTSVCSKATTAGGNSNMRVRLDASLWSSTYQDNAPVQQRATQMYLYFYVGQFSQSATEQTAGLNSELFNGKMDRDMSNMNPSATAKETIVGWGMPDYSAGVSKANNIDYSETTNGYLIVDYTSDTYSELDITINGTSFRFYQGYQGMDYNHCNVGVVPIPKNVQYRITTLNGCRVRYFPCIGG